MRLEPVLTILGMAVATYLTRVGGLWLMGRVERTPRVEKWLRYVPGSILISIVAPMLVESGPQEWTAAAAVLVVWFLTRNMLATLAVGVGVISALRNFL